MIDDRTLEDLLRDACAGIEVPADGPQRVMAARDRLDTERRTSRSGRALESLGHWTGPSHAASLVRRRPLVSGAAALVAIVLAVFAIGLTSSSSHPSTSAIKSAAQGAIPVPASAAGSSSAGSSSAGASSSGSLSYGASSQTSGPSGSTQHATSGAGAPDAAATPSTPSGSATVPEAGPDIIQTGSVTIVIPNGQLSPVMNQLTSDTSGLGGYVSTTTTNTPGGSQPSSGTIVLRVPAAQFGTLLNDTRNLGSPTSVTTSGEDVTSQYADLNAQLKAAQEELSQYEQILAKAQSIGDILSVEQQINGAQSQVQQLQGQLNVMTNQIAYGTLTVTVQERASTKAKTVVGAPPKGLDKAWDHTRSTFARGLESVVSSLGGIGAFLVVVGVLALAARFGWVAVRRRLV